jgi:hypothetical protein
MCFQIVCHMSCDSSDIFSCVYLNETHIGNGSRVLSVDLVSFEMAYCIMLASSQNMYGSISHERMDRSHYLEIVFSDLIKLGLWVYVGRIIGS